MTNQQRVHNNIGFTLIEVLVYIGLLSIIITGSLGVANQITQGVQKDSARLIIQTEADFVLRKLDYALTGAKLSQVTGGSALSIAAGSGFCFVFDSVTSAIMLKSESCASASLAPQPLTSVNVSVSSLSFALNGAAVTSIFVMNGQTFQSTKYLR